MAASKPTSWLSEPSHLVSHLARLGDLNRRSGLFPSRQRTLAPAVCLPCSALPGIRSLRWRGSPRWTPQPLQCSTPESDTRGTTSIVFGENQLFPDLFSLSPLATAHPLPFQREWVRPSTRCYPRFSLAMARSSGFGSTPRNYIRPVRTRFRFASPSRLSSLRNVSR